MHIGEGVRSEKIDLGTEQTDSCIRGQITIELRAEVYILSLCNWGPLWRTCSLVWSSCQQGQTGDAEIVLGF